MERPGLGFGFDAKTEDYKVVRVLYSHDGDYNTDNYKIYQGKDIRTVSSESWRISESTVDGVVSKNHTCAAEIHGALHFKAKRLMERDQKLRLIMSFDLETETFCDIMLPDEFLASENERSWQLSVLHECLSLVVHHQNGQDGTSMHVWVMKEYGVTNSWTKLYALLVLQVFI
ncbi:hypothetical protein SO802_033709 [Lithocarpus litseifolius]|uniref:F-box associated beta-propeller type 1 domain-containing protein n=1 Tax=Lithocarpus litseifolius TaxID=425828 RepID=A0AAW2BH99_9ROSI